MVVFVDLENDELNQNHFVEKPHALFQPFTGPTKPAVGHAHSISAAESTDRALEYPQPQGLSNQPAPNQSSFATALSCYPIVKEIARAVDLNTLHGLSQTCRQFHAILSPYRQQLSKMTLHCENERTETISDAMGAHSSQLDTIRTVTPLARACGFSAGPRGGRFVMCARDMVAECLRCSKTVCRNCAAKPATDTMLKRRIRRLCTTCLTGPLHQLLPSVPPSFTHSAFHRDVCTCNVSVWLCSRCAQHLNTDDLIYRQLVGRRTWYGIGPRLQGVRCWRDEHCLAAQDTEMEVECEEIDDSCSGTGNSQHGCTEPYGEENCERFKRDSVWIRPPLLATYGEDGTDDILRHIFSTGGPIVRMVKKRVMLGAYVDTYENEHETGEYLTREQTGLHRSCCAWCRGMIPSEKDLDMLQTS